MWLSGASSGLGRALARELGRRGASVALFARREAELREVSNEILTERPAGRVLVQPGDVTRRDEVRAAIHAARDEFGAVDVVILNAGIGDMMPPERFSAELVERIFRVNYLGAIYAIEAALPDMLERRSGTIVGVSSMSAVRGLPMAGPYCASKAALATHLESLRLDVRDWGVRVITVVPGFIDTPLTRRNRFPMPFLQTPERSARRIVRGIERGRRVIAFPRRITTPVRLLRFLPGAVYDALLGRVARKGYRKVEE